MRTYNPLAALALCVLSLATISFGSDSKRELELKCFLVSADPPFGDPSGKKSDVSVSREVGLQLVLKNVSDRDIRVGAGAWPSLMGSGSKARITFYLIDVKSPLGETVVSSDVEIRPVLLKPDEITYINAKIKLSIGVRSDSIEIIYKVDEFMSQRYEIWGGSLSCFASEKNELGQ